MTKPDVVAALAPVFLGFGAELTDGQWDQYHLALEDVNPGDLDDALADLRRTHAFRNAPLPAEILARCERYRHARQVETPAPVVAVEASEGEWRTFTFTTGALTGMTTRIQVLPDEHPALPRYACGRCRDTSWEEIPNLTDRPRQPTVRRCACWARNPVLARRRTQAQARRGRA